MKPAKRRVSPRLTGRLVGAVLSGVLAAAALATAPAQAQGLRILTSDFAPLTDSTKPDRGLLHDLVVQLLKLQNIDAKVEFIPSWADAQKMAEETPNTLIFPMTRTAKRENQYLWVLKAFDMDRAFCSRPGSTPVNTVEEAAKLAVVATQEKSASSAFLKDKGLTNVQEMPSSLTQMQALAAGKADAVYQPKPFALADWKVAGGQGALVCGTPIERSASYLAASPKSTLNVEDWRAAFQVIEQDGTFDALLEKYGMKE